MQLSSIHIYPIKSLAGISLQSATVEARGLQHDRRWMLIDNENRFITQRAKPSLALIEITLKDEGFEIRHRVKDIAPLMLPFSISKGTPLDVQVWDDVCSALWYDESGWFKEATGLDCRLVYMHDDSQRLVDPRYAHQNEITSFSDGFPFLLVGEASLDDLNQRLETPVPMNRFRPNLVFTGGAAFEEDTFAQLTIGDVPFLAPKPCARCVFTTIDQVTGKKDLHNNPLKTLATFRTWNNKVMFGENLLAVHPGTVNVGDKLSIEQTKPAIL
jgi:uncharacterized protein